MHHSTPHTTPRQLTHNRVTHRGTISHPQPTTTTPHHPGLSRQPWRHPPAASATRAPPLPLHAASYPPPATGPLLIGGTRSPRCPIPTSEVASCQCACVHTRTCVCVVRMSVCVKGQTRARHTWERVGTTTRPPPTGTAPPSAVCADLALRRP